MDASFFDMLHDSPDNDSLPICERIHINFKSVLHELVNQDRLTWGRLNRVLNETRQMCFGLHESHSPSTQHKGWTHQNRIANALSNLTRFLKRAGDSIFRLRDIQLFEQFRKFFAIF